MRFIFVIILLSISNLCFAEIEMLETGMIYADDLGSIKDNSEWFALVRKDKGFSVIKTKIKLTKDPSDTDEKKGPNANPVPLNITTTEDAVFLIRGIDLKVGPIESKATDRQLKLGELVTFNNGKSYLFASGAIKAENPEFISKHQLNVHFEEKNSTVVNFPEYKYPYSIEWVGDLNSDSIPDVYLTTFDESGDRSSHHFYLSEKDPKTGEIKYKKIEPQYQGC